MKRCKVCSRFISSNRMYCKEKCALMIKRQQEKNYRIKKYGIKTIYQLRKLTVGNRTGDAWGITIPKKFLKYGESFTIQIQKNNYVLVEKND